MIRTVSGKVIFAGKSYLIIEVGASGAGIGLRVFVPDPTLARYRTDMPVTLHTHLQVRENDLSLYGFESPEELSIFELLLNVNGVGPKVALSTLSTLTPDALQLAVSNKEPALVARVPGIGKRTAEKIVLELQGKLTPTGSHLEQLAQTMDIDGEVIDALTALGYSVIEAQRAVQKIPSGVVSVEERLRAALSQFSD